MPLILRSSKGSQLTTAEMDGNFSHLQTQIDTKSVAYSPVTLTVNTTLTRSTHYNRQIIVNTSGTVTLTATGSDALAGDFISIDVIGGGSVTLAGVTAQSGYTLTASSGGTVEAKSLVDASFVAATQSVSTAGNDLTLQDGSPAHWAAAGIVAGVTTDFAGTTRHVPPSIGCYE